MELGTDWFYFISFTDNSSGIAGDASVTPTSEVCSTDMLVLLISGIKLLKVE
jgi:hypothetical protein